MDCIFSYSDELFDYEVDENFINTVLYEGPVEINGKKYVYLIDEDNFRFYCAT